MDFFLELLAWLLDITEALAKEMWARYGDKIIQWALEKLWEWATS